MTTEKCKHLVVVDDDIDIQDLISAYFKPKGYQITCFSDAESALAKSNSQGTDWDVLLTDLLLPKMTGLEFTISLRKVLPSLPIILISTSKSAETALEAVENGAYDFLVKPLHLAQLQISIERALHLQNLRGDITDLREILSSNKSGARNIIGKSPKFLQALDIAKRVAASKTNLFITGESGTGKDVFAKFIHNASSQRSGPLVTINCSAIPENLLESELFGYAKGAFTGANDKKIGLFEAAQDGTIFLDEIGDLSLPLQAKLLRVLQERKIKRVGENQDRSINCRVISATHKDLSKEVFEGRFREDLFYRLNVIPISIPPLRERQEDLIPLATLFLKRFALENGTPIKTLSPEATSFLLTNPWRGNVRELENAIERAVVLCPDQEITMEHFMPLASILASEAPVALKDPAQRRFVYSHSVALPLLEDVIHSYIEYAIQANQGARDKTARDIGIDRKTLYKKMRLETAQGSSNSVSAT
jgi:DNA-binding NtrC family response regulator